MFNFKNFFTLFIFIFVFLFPFSNTSAQEEFINKDFCTVYFSGIGCPHCAKSDPTVLKNILNDNENVVTIEYEVYQSKLNANLMSNYKDIYRTGYGIPLLIFNKDLNLSGDSNIVNQYQNKVEELETNNCPLSNGNLESINSLDIVSLPYLPKLWTKDRVLIKREGGASNDFLKKILIIKDLSSFIEEVDTYRSLEDKSAPFSGGEVNFDNAVEIDGWDIKWNGRAVEEKNIIKNEDDNSKLGFLDGQTLNTDFTWFKIISLALVDAVNPCAFAVLILMLTTILAYNPKNRRNLILAGLSFVLAVFVMYLFYGLIIIKFIKVVESVTSIRYLMYKVFGLLAIILGILNIKDFISYKPGSFGTEMPLFLRPRVKKIISGVTSPGGAFLVGIFVTLFLLPCTIGPYIIASSVLSVSSILQSLPPLLIYNLIFVLPMLIIVGIVYLGLKRVDDVSLWKEKNTNKLHLMAGIIMLVLGLAMFLGWV